LRGWGSTIIVVTLSEPRDPLFDKVGTNGVDLKAPERRHSMKSRVTQTSQ